MSLFPHLPLQRIVEVARLYDQRLDTITRMHGLSRARYEVLLAARGAKSVPSIARLLGRSRQSVQTIVDGLAEAGLVRFEANPAHRRSPLVDFTDPGARIAERIEREVGRWENAAVANLEAEETEVLLLALDTLRDGLER